MILSSLLSAGAFSLVTQALLIPEIDVDASPSTAPLLLDVGQVSQTVNVDCSTCPYALNSVRNGAHEWTADVASDIELNFLSDKDTIKVNDVPFYPLQNPALPPTLFVTQEKKEDVDTSMEGYEGKLRLSYSMEYKEQKFEENSLVTILMTIMGLDGEMVTVDDIEIKVIKEADGKLTFHSITTIPASPNAPDAKCTNMMCRVFTKLISGIHKAKASAKGATRKIKCFCMKCIHKLTGHHSHNHHKNKGPHAVPHRRPDGIMKLPTHIQFKPFGHKGGPHHHAHHHHKGFLARMCMVLRTAVKVVFIPILIGVAFGMAASAIGMLVGQILVFLWLKFVRRSDDAAGMSAWKVIGIFPRRHDVNGAYERVETDEKEVPPPAYQDVEGKEALSEKEVEDKA